MHRRRAVLVVLVSLTALLAAPVAYAHISFVPGEAPERSFARLQVSVPNEDPVESTVRVAIEIPESVVFVRVPPTPGWRVNLEREPLEEPLLVRGERVEERVSIVEWRGGEISGSDRVSFAIRLAVPRAAGQTIAFRSTQTYSDGRVVQWIGEPGSATPAPLLTVTQPDPSAPTIEIRPAPDPPPPPAPPATTTEPETETEEGEPDSDEPEAAPAPAADDDEGGLSAPLLLALALGIAALLAAAGWLLARRRRAT